MKKSNSASEQLAMTKCNTEFGLESVDCYEN